MYDRLPAAPGIPGGGRGAVVAPGHPAAAARVFVREGDCRQFALAFPPDAGVPTRAGSPGAGSPTDVRPATLAAQVEQAVRRAVPGAAPDATRRAPAAVRAASTPLRVVDDEGTAWRVYDARETPPPHDPEDRDADPPPPRRPGRVTGRVTLAEYREFLEREAARQVPRAPVRVLAPGHPAATHRLFVRAGDRWRFDCRLGPAEVGDCAERTLRAQLGHALGGDPSPRGLSAEAHRARCREHRATRGA